MAERRFSNNGEWLESVPEGVKVGLTSIVVDDLGDVTFVGLPQVGQWVQQGDAVVALEAVKAAQDLLSPVGGMVLAINPAVADDPSLLNQAPLETWLFVLDKVSPESWSSLLTADQWKARTEGSK